MRSSRYTMIIENEVIKYLAVEKETGMDTVSFVSNKIEKQNSKNRLKRDFKKLVKNNFEKTREILILQDQSNTFK